MTTLFVLAVFGGLCAGTAARKGRSVVGWFILGFLFNLFALIVVALLPNKRALATAIATAVANATANNHATQNVVVNLTGYAPIAPQPVSATQE